MVDYGKSQPVNEKSVAGSEPVSYLDHLGGGERLPNPRQHILSLRELENVDKQGQGKGKITEHGGMQAVRKSCWFRSM